jgi:hypothetical protein
MAAGAHACIIRATNRYQDNARLQEMACRALWSLADKDETRIIRETTAQHQDDERVQETACDAQNPVKRPRICMQ